MWSPERTPTILLLRDPTSYTTAMYLERALGSLCNVKTIVALPPQFMYPYRKLPIAIRRGVLQQLVRAAISSDPPFHHVDLLLVADPLYLGFAPEGLARRTAYYAIDSHIAFREHSERARAADYDFVFVAQKDDLSKYSDIGCKQVEWLPLAFDPDIHHKLLLEKTRNMSFVGRAWPSEKPWERARWDMLQTMRERAGLEIQTTFLHDMVRVYNQSRIVFNKSLNGDLNMRVFEALGCGAFLLTDQIENGMEELFVDRYHLATYRTVEEAIELARYFLSHEEERDAVALRGWRHVHAQHTYRHRAAALLRRCLGYVAPEPASPNGTPIL